MFNKQMLVISATLLLIAGQSIASPTLGQVDDFQDNTAQGWGVGQSGSTTVITTNLSDSGPGGVGDTALDVEFALRAAFLNRDDRWTGDFAGAGVTAIRVDVNNTSDQALNLRLGIRGPEDPFLFPQGGGDSWITDSQTVAALSGWTTLTFGLNSSDLTSPGTGNDAAAALTDVQQLRILDNAAADYRGQDVSVNYGFVVDNITAVPEPNALALIGFGGLMMIRRRRRACR